jgi:acyl-CoA thioesterase-1
LISQTNFVPEHALSSHYLLAHAGGLSAAWILLTLLLYMAFPATAAPSPGAARVMVSGDSLSAAYGLRENEGWVSLLSQRVKPQGMTVINASISGETTNGGLSRIRTDLARNKPSIVVIALGANDGLRGLPTADTRKNLQAMISACKATGAQVVLVGMQIPPNYGVDYARQFRDLYGELARENKVFLVPFLLEGIADKLELFQADRLHPIAAAQPRILENVLPAVLKAAGTKSTPTSKPHPPAATGATP